MSTYMMRHRDLGGEWVETLYYTRGSYVYCCDPDTGRDYQVCMGLERRGDTLRVGDHETLAEVIRRERARQRRSWARGWELC